MITTDLQYVIKQLTRGEIVAIPTETVYGLAGNALHEVAIKKIYALKNRPLTHPLILHIAPDADLSSWVSYISKEAQTLMDAFWPGPLTLVFPCKPGCLPSLVNAGQNTVAIRAPHHPVTTPLLQQLDFPLVAPSANLFGKISPTTAEHVTHGLKDPSLLVLDGGRCPIGIESTIIDVSQPTGYQILRHGIIDEEALNTLLPNRLLQTANSVRVPGKLPVHYQPEKPLHCFSSSESMQVFCKQNPQAYILSFQKKTQFANYAGVELICDPQALAYALYYELRRADESNAPLIVLELPPDTIAWAGIRDRLKKAGSWH